MRPRLLVPALAVLLVASAPAATALLGETLDAATTSDVSLDGTVTNSTVTTEPVVETVVEPIVEPVVETVVEPVVEPVVENSTPEVTLDANVPELAASLDVVGELLVGYEEGRRDAALLEIQLAGGIVKAIDEALGVAVVTTNSPTHVSRALGASDNVSYVEENGQVVSTGAQWNGAQWNGAEWNGAQWNGAKWSGAQWNGAQWNGAEWNTAVRDRFGPSDDPGRFGQWGLLATNVSNAWRTSMGTRAAQVCVVDSGIDSSHMDLAPNLWRDAKGANGINFVDSSRSADDDAGHGTHMAGIVGATIGNAWGTAGMGNVLLMNAKILDSNGQGTEANLAWAISWCARNDADVILMALTASEPGPALERAINFAANQDVLLVAAAGNSGCSGCVSYPASHPSVIAVSPVDPLRNTPSFASKGQEVELAAPGVDVLSTWPGSLFATGSGSSHAAAFAAGAAALLRDQHPGASAEEVRQALDATARDLGSAGRDSTYGYGLVNVGSASVALAS